MQGNTRRITEEWSQMQNDIMFFKAQAQATPLISVCQERNCATVAPRNLIQSRKPPDSGRPASLVGQDRDTPAIRAELDRAD